MHRIFLAAASAAMVGQVSGFSGNNFAMMRMHTSPGSLQRIGSRPCAAVTMDAQPTTHDLRRRFLRLSGAAVIGTALLDPHSAFADLAGKPDVEWYSPVSVTDQKYSGEEWQGAVWSAPKDEDSISWKQFVGALQLGDVAVVDFVGKSGEKVYATLTSKDNLRIRIGQGLPDETTPPLPKPACAACLEACPPERKDCSCLSTCGGKKDWNSPLYTARLVRANKVPFRYSEGEDLAYSSMGNKARRFMMFDGPMSAGIK